MTEIRLGMPLNVFFCRDQHGKVHVFFNDKKADMDTVHECLTSLSKFVLETSNEDIQKYNEWLDNQRKKEELSCMRESKKQKLKEKVSGYIYVIESTGLYKIGRTLNIQSRMKTYVTENPHPTKLIIDAQVNDYESVEKTLHKTFKNKRVRGEWFNLNKKDLIEIKEICKQK